MEKTTTQLLSQLTQARSLAEFKQTNAQELVHPQALEYDLSLLQKHEIKSKAQAFDLSQYTPTYVYSVFRGQRPLHRNLCLALALAISCTLEETQSLLKYAGLAQLYPRDPRDLLIIFSLNKKYGTVKANDLLKENNFPLLVDNA